MKLGIMQPYVFPYIGYYQLINAVDRFVVYDDVNFIKQGWLNRNRILLNGNAFTFTVPLQDASSFVKIVNTGISDRLYNAWREKFLKTLKQAYAKAPHFSEVEELVSSVLQKQCSTISELATESLTASCRYLGINTEFILTAVPYNNDHLKAQERVIDICKKEKADIYINLAGGMELYNKDDFAQEGMELKFIKSDNIQYKQTGNGFIPALSMIDVLMFNTPGEIKNLLNEYSLV